VGGWRVPEVVNLPVIIDPFPEYKHGLEDLIRRVISEELDKRANGTD
jgi:hypothetical protein